MYKCYNMAVATFEVLYETIAMTEFSNIIELQTRRTNTVPNRFICRLAVSTQHTHICTHARRTRRTPAALDATLIDQLLEIAKLCQGCRHY